MIRRTSMNLDTDLVREAARVLGTGTATETVHRALRESIRRERLSRLARRPFADLTEKELAHLRRTRTARSTEPEGRQEG
jgi:Arc/MetJ family transcription regulator